MASRRFGPSILTKIFLGFAAVIASFGTLAVYLEVHGQRAAETLRLVVQDYVPASGMLRELRATQNQAITLLPKVMDESPVVAREWLGRWRNIRPGSLQGARDTIASIQARDLPPAEPAYLAILDRELERIARVAAANGPLYDALFARLDARDTAGAAQTLRDLERRERLLVRRLSRLERSLSDRMRDLAGRVAAEQAAARSNLLGLAAIAFAVALVVWIVVFRTLSPIGRMRESAAAVARGDLAQRLALQRRDELGRLAEEFDRMTEALVARDERLRSQARDLISAERLAAIGKMAAHITHEVRNPLSSIGLNAELLADELERLGADATEARALLVSIAREIDRLTAITEQYLRVARLPSPRCEPVDLGDLVRSVADFVRPEVESAGVALEVEIEPLRAVPLDEAQIRQVLVNLLRNAREATPRGGRIRIALAPEADEVVLRVSDSGAGVAAEVLPQIFDAFFTTKEHGTGLGLPLVRQIVVAHGGTVACESRPGQGTTFLVRLPAPAAPASTDEAAQASPPVAR